MKKRILLVDDDDNAREDIKKFLAPFMNDIEVEEACNYGGAIDVLKKSAKPSANESNISIVITDLNLEDYSRKEGLDIIEYVERFHRNTTKIVLYSAGNPAWTVSRHLKYFENTVLLFWCPIEELVEGKREYKNLIWNVLDKHTDSTTDIFISYSHADAEWLKRVQVHLKPIERKKNIKVWDDTRIQPGENWLVEIKRNIESAAAAILLISADFLASEFIANSELPAMLKMAQSSGTKIFPIIIKPCAYSESELNIFQAVNTPSEPLINMDESGRESVFTDLATSILGFLRNR